MNSKALLLNVLLVFGLHAGMAQGHSVHSHNDYLQPNPFWDAFNAGVRSIEVDVFLRGDVLRVAHSRSEIDARNTLQRLYLEPLKEVIAAGRLEHRNVQLVIDVKSEAYKTLDAISSSLDAYPSIRDCKWISIVISGNRPKPSDYVKYPQFIRFDYQRLESITDVLILNKIAMVSVNFAHYSSWDGVSALPAVDFKIISEVIAKAHELKKPFRFWASPDTETAWKTFVKMGVDFIHTDMPAECVQYVTTLE